MQQNDSRTRRMQRHARVRARVVGTPERPRLCVFRSLKHISAQVIDDVSGKTLVAASDRDVKSKMVNVAAAHDVGALIAQRAKKAGISAVVFDRGGHAYHGKIKALADGAREEGLTF